MCKIVETKWTKEELESYMRCCLDQLILMSRKYIKVDYKAGTLIDRVDYYFYKVMEYARGKSTKTNAIKYYKKAVIMNTLLKAGVYKEGD